MGGSWSEDLPAGLSEQRPLRTPRVLWLPVCSSSGQDTGRDVNTSQGGLWEDKAVPDPRESSRLQSPAPLLHMARAACLADAQHCP